jgi:hypothetical protein
LSSEDGATSCDAKRADAASDFEAGLDTTSRRGR